MFKERGRVAWWWKTNRLLWGGWEHKRFSVMLAADFLCSLFLHKLKLIVGLGSFKADTLQLFFFCAEINDLTQSLSSSTIITSAPGRCRVPRRAPFICNRPLSCMVTMFRRHKQLGLMGVSSHSGDLHTVTAHYSETRCWTPREASDHKTNKECYETKM